MKNSTIEWTQHTFNPWWGCAKVSPGCENCYAQALAKRFGHNLWGPGADRRQLSKAYWKQPIAWDAEAARTGTRARVFCASMADVFEDRRDLDASREHLWSTIEATTNLDWLLLTKRPQNVAGLVPWGTNWPNNVWLGATAENQHWLDERMPALIALDARVLFLSCEPLLGSIDLSHWINGAHSHKHRQIDWVIAGGESGHHARPMHPEWLTFLRDQCIGANISFHFKQWGNWRPVSSEQIRNHSSRQMVTTDGKLFTVANLGKKASGRLLQGRAWDEFPATCVGNADL